VALPKPQVKCSNPYNSEQADDYDGFGTALAWLNTIAFVVCLMVGVKQAMYITRQYDPETLTTNFRGPNQMPASGLKWVEIPKPDPTVIPQEYEQLRNAGSLPSVLLSNDSAEVTLTAQEWKEFGTDYGIGSESNPLFMYHFVECIEEGASGLKWSDAGPEMRANWKELTNERLSKALEDKTVFTEDEWNMFGIDRLQMDHCIRSGNSYFQPAAAGEPNCYYYRPAEEQPEPEISHRPEGRPRSRRPGRARVGSSAGAVDHSM
jgi:hypothetical protein